jgi:hypothetical protein
MEEGYSTLGEVFTVPVAHKRVTFLIGPDVAPHFFKATDDEMSQTEVYNFNVPTFGKGVVYDVDQKVWGAVARYRTPPLCFKFQPRRPRMAAAPAAAVVGARRAPPLPAPRPPDPPPSSQPRPARPPGPYRAVPLLHGGAEEGAPAQVCAPVRDRGRGARRAGRGRRQGAPRPLGIRGAARARGGSRKGRRPRPYREPASPCGRAPRLRCGRAAGSARGAPPPFSQQSPPPPPPKLDPPPELLCPLGRLGRS